MVLAHVGGALKLFSRHRIALDVGSLTCGALYEFAVLRTAAGISPEQLFTHLSDWHVSGLRMAAYQVVHAVVVRM